MATKQYIGARYVPLFADPIDWDKTKTYEPLTIVYHQGNSYTSRQSVPTGVDITDTTYWALTGNYNAQVEQYRNEVNRYKSDIDKGIQADSLLSYMGITDNTTAGNHINAIDENHKNTQANTDALTAFKIDTPEKAVKQLQHLDLEYAKILCIGDSFGDERATDHANWVKRLRNKLPNATIKNQCVSGSGYTRNYGVKFLQQLTTAKNEGFAPDYIIVAGGVNDTDEAPNDVYRDARDVCHYILSNFASAVTYFVPMMAGVYHIDSKRRVVAQNIIKAISGEGFAYLKQAWTWNLAQEGNVVSDHLHPTEQGAINICNKIYNALKTGFTETYLNVPTKNEVWNVDGNLSYYVSNGVFYLKVQTTITETSSDTSMVTLNLPEQYASSAIPCIMGYMAGAEKPQRAYLTFKEDRTGLVINIPKILGQMQLTISYEM